MLSSLAKIAVARSSSFLSPSSLASSSVVGVAAAAARYDNNKLLAKPRQALYSTTAVRMNAELPDSMVVLEYKYAPHFLMHREQHHQGHLMLAEEMIRQGKCIAGGPIAPHITHSFDGTFDGVSFGTEPTGAFFWFHTLEDAQHFWAHDPYALANLVTDLKIYDWTVAVKT